MRSPQNQTIDLPGFGIGLGAFYWLQQFLKEIKNQNRFFPSEATQALVEQIIAFAAKNRVSQLRAGETFYRSRLLEPGAEIEHLPLDHMGAPPKHKTAHGRLNPRGIPYLYLADDRETAVAEVRPWIGAALTVAQFDLEQNARVLDFCKREVDGNGIDERPDQIELLWRSAIPVLFSLSYKPDDLDVEYTPTQYIAERVKRAGFDGVLYDSAMRKGKKNLALFDTTRATATRLWIVHVRALEYELDLREPTKRPDGAS